MVNILKNIAEHCINGHFVEDMCHTLSDLNFTSLICILQPIVI